MPASQDDPLTVFIVFMYHLSSGILSITIPIFMIYSSFIMSHQCRVNSSGPFALHRVLSVYEVDLAYESYWHSIHTINTNAGRQKKTTKHKRTRTQPKRERERARWKTIETKKNRLLPQIRSMFLPDFFPTSSEVEVFPTIISCPSGIPMIPIILLLDLLLSLDLNKL